MKFPFEKFRKKNILLIFTIFLLFVTPVKLSVSQSLNHISHSFNYIADTFENEISKSSHFVMFFTSWCGHCQKLRGAFEMIAQRYNNVNFDRNEVTIKVAKVDCDQDIELCNSHNITRYPTLKFYWSDVAKSYKYKGKKSYAGMILFVEDMRVLDAPLPQEISDPKLTKKNQASIIPYELTPSSFVDLIASSNLIFINFYAPWCSHCHAIQATWKQLHEEMLHEGIIIAKLDCTTHTNICTRHDIRAYPTLLVFKESRVIAQYEDIRDFDRLKLFITNLQRQNNPNTRPADTIPKPKTENALKDGKNNEYDPRTVSINEDLISGDIGGVGKSKNDKDEL